jgi:hypothetical protein
MAVKAGVFDDAISAFHLNDEIRPLAGNTTFVARIFIKLDARTRRE